MSFSKPSLVAGLILLFSSPTYGQVGIGTNSPDPSAQLEVRSTNKGFLPPSIALQGTDDAQLTSPSTPRIVSPATGLLVYNTATAGTGATAVAPGYYYYSGNAWVRLVTGTVSIEYGGTGQSSLAGVKSILGLTGISVAIGQDAGATGQGPETIAIGKSAASTNQGPETIAIGKSAASTNQGPESIAIGKSAASTNQGPVSIAIGKSAAQLSQGFQAIALGVEAGQNNQGTNAVAIGTKAGNTSQAANSIAINASGVNLNPSTSGFYVDPIRNVSGSNTLYYNTATKEVTYSNVVALSPTYLGINTTLSSIHNGAIIYTEHGAWPVFPEDLPDGFKCTIIMHSNHPWTSNTLTTAKFFSKLTTWNSGTAGRSTFSISTGGMAEIRVVTIGGIKCYFVSGDIGL